jgi:hypothetical protein
MQPGNKQNKHRLIRTCHGSSAGRRILLPPGIRLPVHAFLPCRAWWNVLILPRNIRVSARSVLAVLLSIRPSVFRALLRLTAMNAYPAPGGNGGLLLWLTPPSWVPAPPPSFGTGYRLGGSPENAGLVLGSGPARLWVPRQTREQKRSNTTCKIESLSLDISARMPYLAPPATKPRSPYFH